MRSRLIRVEMDIPDKGKAIRGAAGQAMADLEVFGMTRRVEWEDLRPPKTGECRWYGVYSSRSASQPHSGSARKPNCSVSFAGHPSRARRRSLLWVVPPRLNALGSAKRHEAQSPWFSFQQCGVHLCT